MAAPTQGIIAEGLPAKPPWKPHVAALMAFFFGPLAGVFVTYANLRRLGQPQKANQILRWSIVAIPVVILVLVYLPNQLMRPFGLGIEVAGAAVYRALQRDDFALWEQRHPGSQPASGWSSFGLAVLGIVAFVAVGLSAGFGQSKLVEVCMNRGNQLLDQKRFEEARKEYRLAARIDPSDPHPHFGMAASFAEQEKWADAGREYQAACRLKSDDDEVVKACKELEKPDRR